MIQLQILSGRQAGRLLTIARLPCLIGRTAEADIQLDDAGVWDRHAEISFAPDRGFVCQPQSSATLWLNHEKTGGSVLHNGDLIEAGSVQLRFWLAPGIPRGTRFREAATWVALIALFGAQIGLICLLWR